MSGLWRRLIAWFFAVVVNGGGGWLVTGRVETGLGTRRTGGEDSEHTE